MLWDLYAIYWLINKCIYCGINYNVVQAEREHVPSQLAGFPVYWGPENMDFYVEGKQFFYWGASCCLREENVQYMRLT